MHSHSQHESSPRRGMITTGAKVVLAGLALLELGHITGDFGISIPGFSGSTTEAGSASVDLESYSVDYVPLDCSSEVSALAGTKVTGDYHLPIVHWTSGVAEVNKKVPLQWGECTTDNDSKTPAVIGRVNGKVVSVVAPIPIPHATNLGVADLNLDVCLPLKSDAPESEEKADRANYIKDAKAGHVDPCDLESQVSGFVVNDATPAETIEISRQLADLAGYLQQPPAEVERKIMKDAQRAMIAQEERAYPGAKVSAPLSHMESPFQSTMQGWKDIMTQTDTQYMFSNIHFSSSRGQTELHIGANSINGVVTLDNDRLSETQVKQLNEQVPHY